MKRKKELLITYHNQMFYLIDYSKFFHYKMKFKSYSLLSDYISSVKFNDYKISIEFSAYLSSLLEPFHFIIGKN